MPMYTFRCACGLEEERMLEISERDSEFDCPNCGEPMARVLEAPKLGRPRYQMQAVLGSGEHVPGHFGKTAPIPAKKGGGS